MKRELSQQEIDAVFQGSSAPTSEAEPAVPAFDFNRLDRIPKSQLRAIHLLHEDFARSLASSLSAYLRSYVTMNLISIEQTSYSEFVEGIASPTCIAYLGLHPLDGTAVLELNSSLMFNLIEILMGSNGQAAAGPVRKITEIEASIVQMLLRVVLQSLSAAWKNVAEIQVSVQSLASEPQLMNALAPSEAVVVITIEMQLPSKSGLLNLALPSIFVKRMRDRFEQLRQVRRAESTINDQLRTANLIQTAQVRFEASLSLGAISLEELLTLEVDDLLFLRSSHELSFSGLLNGREKWVGEVVEVGQQRGFQIGGEL